MLITSPEFTSNLTGKTYYTKSFDPLDGSTKNVIQGIECTICGLLYVGETRQTLYSLTLISFLFFRLDLPFHIKLYIISIIPFTY
jgi:hypothetical protein